MIFKTFQSDLDGISNKIGFSKRSFAEWGKQVSTSFKESEGVVNKFKNTLKTAFTVPIEKDNSWIKNDLGEIVTKKNIDSFIPKLDTNSARTELSLLQSIQNKINETKGSWDDYNNQFKDGRKYLLDYAKQNNVLESSVDNLKEANQQARAFAIAHNEAIKAQTLSAKAGSVALKALSIAGNMLAFWAISKGIQFAVSAFDNYIHRVEKANEATKEAIDTFKSITSEVESIENKLSDLNDQISKLDPVTDEEDINNIKLETEELKTQLAILKEKQRIAETEADTAAQKSLGMTQESRYKTGEVESAYGGVEVTAVYVTKDEELLNAIEAYDEYKIKVDEANKALADMAEAGGYSQKEWRKQEKIVSTYTKKMEAARSHANELAVVLNEQKQGLNGNTEASQKMLDVVDSTIERYNEWLNVITGTTGALNQHTQTEKKTANKTPLSFSLTESQSKSIDDFQSKVKTLSDTLTAINKGTFEPSDIADLLKEFPELAGKTDNLQGAIQNLIYTLLNKLYKTLGQNIPPELENALQAIADEAANASSGTKTLSEAISDIQSSYDLMQTVSEEISNGGMSASTLQNITDKYPQLENAVNAYCAGLLTEQELYEQLETQYQKDYEEFQAANQAKIYENELFFEMSYEKNGELVNALAKKYKLDLDNFKTVEDAKLLGEAKLLGKLSSMWSDYYNIILGEDGLYHIQQLNSGYVIENDENYIAMEETRVKMQEFLNDLNESFDLGNLGLDDISWNTGRLDKSSSPASDPAKDTAEIFDWLEIKIASCTEALKKYTDARDNAFTTYGTRNNALAKEIGQTQELLTLQETAAKKYEEYADSFGLSDYYKQLVQSGAVVIEPIDETLKEQIQNYKTWYDKAHESKKAVEELKQSLSELAQTNFNMITSEFEDVLSAFETRAKSINNAISLTETKGYAVSTRYYQALIDDETKQIRLLEQEYTALTKSLNESVESGRIKEGSKTWYDMRSSIANVRNAIEEADNSLAGFRNTIRKLKWDAFDRLQDTISKIKDESEFIIDLFSGMEMFDDNGTILNTGLAAAGQHAVNYNVLMAQADNYADEYKSVMKELADDPYNQTLIDRTRELAQAQRDAIKSAQDEKQALIELAKEGIQKEIDAMQKLVDIKKKMLDTDTSLYEYEQNVAKQSENIASIEKQIAAVQGDNSEENMKRLQQLNKELADAQKQLEETEYDRWKSDQQDMLDEMMSEYEELQNERMNETEKLFREYIATVNANSDLIHSTVTQTTEALGYTLSGEMQEIWNAQSMQNGEYRSVVSGYCDGFENQLTSVNKVLDEIKEADREAMDRLNREAANTTSETANVGRKIDELAQALLNATSRNSASAAMPDNLNNGNGSSNAAPDNTSSPAARESTNDGIPNIGDKVYAKGRWYGDSNGGGAESNVDILKPSYYRIAHTASPGAKYGYNIQGYDENNNPTRGNGWVNLDQLIGYAKGTKRAAKDFAWTQENGGEIIRTSDGALLTPVKDGMVFSNEASRRLWEIANGKGEFPEQLRELFALPSYNIPQTPVMNNNVNTSNVNNGDVNITMEMNLPNVTNAKEFENQLIRTMQDSSRVKKCINSFTVDIAAGKHPMAYNRF